ncbi:HIT family protein [Candidatus Woesearchaeota archaeon]|nr:MAG: HIT family protein [Candidatus Woesearchaeota archaeon]
MNDQCIFCAIANGKVPSQKVYEDDKVAAVLDINPANPGHILIIPKSHVQIMPQMDEALAGHCGIMAKQLSGILISQLKVEGTSIFVANGAAAGQRAPHVMIHVIPRAQGDGVGLSIPENKVKPELLLQITERLSPAIEKHFGKVLPANKGKEALKKETERDENKSGGEQSKKGDESQNNEGGESAEGGKPSLDDIANLLTGGK